MSFAASVARADWGDFVPHPIENGAYLDMFGSYERDNNRSEGTQSARWDDSFIREKVTLYSIGYSYHPRFLQYRFSVGGAVRQENYNSSATGSTGWGDGTGLEYDAKLFFLPEHPYNVEAFARRFEPLFKEQSSVQHNNVETSRGISCRYRQKPYFVHVSYVDDSIESGTSSSDVTRVGLDGQYLKRFKGGNELSFSGAFNPSWFSTSQGLEGSADEYLLGNSVHLPLLPIPFSHVDLPVEARLNSSVTKNTSNQEGQSSERFDYDQFTWYELLNLYWPLGFRTDASYRYQDNSGTISAPTPAQNEHLSNKDKGLEVDILHKLYQSVDTTYTFRRDWQFYNSGDATSTSHSLAVNYTKLLPAQSRLLAGVSLARIDTASTGQANTVNEAHPQIPVPAIITIQKQNVEPTSIVILFRAPALSPEWMQLINGVDYYTISLGTATEIHIFNLPAPFVVPGTYDFSVSYALLSGTFDLRVDTFGSSLSVQLFEDLLTPYASYTRVRSEVLSGTFPGVPLDSKTYTTGLLIHRDPLRLRGEYQRLDWNVGPYRLWTLEAQYVWPMSASTSAYATASYTNKYYPQGTSGLSPGEFSTVSTAAYREEAETAAATVQKQLVAWNMSLSAGGSYSHLHGLIDSDAYSLNGAWMWRIGKVDLSIGVTAYESDTSGTTSLSTRRDHQLVYLKLRRKLF